MASYLFNVVLAVSFGITDEIFAVSMQRKEPLSVSYLAGLIAGPMIGWTGGTLAGGALTRLLPVSVSNALGIALYGMFIAVVVPAAKKNKAVLFTAGLAAVLSAVCYYTPKLSFLSGGWSVILITIIASGAAALIFPIAEEEEEGP